MNALNTSHSTYDRRSCLLAGANLLLAVGGLVACSSPPPAEPKSLPTTVELTLSADLDVNPDARGRPSPLQLRVYALTTLNVFSSADFFALHEKDQATLGAEMVRKEAVLLSPGQSRKLSLTLGDDVRALAFMAVYRELERARWRESVQLLRNKPQTVDVRCMSKQLLVHTRLID